VPKAPFFRERLFLRACGVTGAFLVHVLALSCDFEPVGSGIIAVVGGFMVWVGARTLLTSFRQRADNWGSPGEA
jgi:hypothetical protein